MKTIRELIGLNISDFFHDRDVRKEIRRLIPSNSGATIYTGDGSLGGDRTIQLNGKVLTMVEEGYPIPSFLIDPTEDAEHSLIGAINDTDDGNYGAAEFTSSSTEGSASLQASFNGGVNGVGIDLDARSDNSKILITGRVNGTLILLDDIAQTFTYTADTHIFNVNTNFTIQNGNPDRFGLLIIPTVGEEVSAIKAPNDAAEVGAFFTSNIADGYFWEINAEQAKIAKIIGRGDDGIITYTADIHNIVGVIQTGGQETFTGTLADAITGNKNVVNGLIVD